MLCPLGADPDVAQCLLPTLSPHRKNVGIEIRQTYLTLCDLGSKSFSLNGVVQEKANVESILGRGR